MGHREFTTEVEYILDINIGDHVDIGAVLFAEVYYSSTSAVIRMDPGESHPPEDEWSVKPLILTYKNPETRKMVHVTDPKKIKEIAGEEIRRHQRRIAEKAIEEKGDDW